jgi:hypothetical protein
VEGAAFLDLQALYWGNLQRSVDLLTAAVWECFKTKKNPVAFEV